MTRADKYAERARELCRSVTGHRTPGYCCVSCGRIDRALEQADLEAVRNKVTEIDKRLFTKEIIQSDNALRDQHELLRADLRQLRARLAELEKSNVESRQQGSRLKTRPKTTAKPQSTYRGWCENGHEKGQRGCALCEAVY